MRGGRNIDGCGARTGEERPSQILAVTACPASGISVAAGSPWNRQHEQLPLHSSRETGSGSAALGCCEEIPKYGPSHISQWREWIAVQANSAHKSHAIARGRVLGRQTILRRSTLQ